MDEETKAIRKNDKGELKSFPKEKKKKKEIGARQVYKAKKNAKREAEKCKLKLVAKGCKQQQGIHYANETDN